MILIFSALSLIAAVAIWRSAWQFKVDASPVGSMMLVVSIALGVMSIFLFGVQVGMII